MPITCDFLGLWWGDKPPEHEDVPGFRLATCEITPQSFDAPNATPCHLAWRYAGANFMVSPPRRLVYKAVVADMLLQTLGSTGHRQLDAREVELAAMWPMGWQADSCAHYIPGMEDALQSKLVGRLSWLCPLFSVTSFPTIEQWLHPSEDRLLSHVEIKSLVGKELVLAWADEQTQACLENSWGDEDWESSYDALTDQWTGGDTPGALRKHFDLSDWRGHNMNWERYGNGKDERVRDRRRPMALRRKQVP